jgi:hypothetical protein
MRTQSRCNASMLATPRNTPLMTSLVSASSCCCAPVPAAQVVLMRVHASASELFDRQLEIDTFRGVSKAGLGPQLLMLYTNGRVEEFLGQHVSRSTAAASLASKACHTAHHSCTIHFLN